MEKFFTKQDGTGFKSFVGYIDEATGELVMPPIPADMIEVPTAPEDARQKWNVKEKRWLSLHESGVRIQQ